MTWVRLDDQIWANRKLRRVGPATRWFWVAGLAFSNATTADGLLPDWTPGAIGASARDVRALVEHGFWVPAADGGWQIHDYGEYQPVNGELSAKRAAAGRKGGRAKANRQQT